MFIDEVKIKVISGKGGEGIVSWRREKYIPKGGPRGGDGGRGGNVFLQTTANLNTLSEYRHKKVLKAESGERGGSNTCHGANAPDLILKVPVGTIVRDQETNEIIVDLDKNNTKYLIAKGGRGGYGNAHFCSSVRQAPAFAELGDVEEEKDLLLELKLVADVGIIGIPSSGKSTFIGKVTNVKPKIGDYPFTTITPNLGVLEHKGKSLVLEDVPGLIPGASSGKGLGIEFLKHIERTGVLLHLLDLYRLDKVFEDYEKIRKELEIFSDNSSFEGVNLRDKEEIIVLSKADLLDDEMKDFILKEFKKKYPEKKVFIMSSATGEGIEELKDFLVDNYGVSEEENLNTGEDEQEIIKLYDLKETVEDTRNVELEYIGDMTFRAYGKRLEQIVRMTNFDNKEAILRIYDVLEKIGVTKKLEKKFKEILEQEDVDNSFFFEGNDDINPKVIIGDKEISLNKLKYNL